MLQNILFMDNEFKEWVLQHEENNCNYVAKYVIYGYVYNNQYDSIQPK